ncbi:MAG: hypothetical protein NTW87_11260 [Planctomycetota bacterium]|nr:hypothetical protein [Planctomycetota bacterium]
MIVTTPKSVGLQFGDRVLGRFRGPNAKIAPKPGKWPGCHMLGYDSAYYSPTVA